jgi:endonuclease/exonuclease/phosphatase family metal-dependent hydrolase
MACRSNDLGEDVLSSSQSVGGAGAGPATSASASSGGQGGAGSGPAANEASVVSWNLESFPLTPGAVAGAAAIVEDLRPDVIALQELADPAGFEQLLAALPDYDGVLNDDPGAFLRVGLLTRRERVTVDEVRTLFASDWYAFPRPPLAARVHIDAAIPIDFVAVVLHLKAQLDGESEARRRAACEALDAWVKAELASSEEQDYVLLGDFNDKITDPPQWNVFGAFLDQPELYSFLTMPAAQAGEHSYIPFESMIDHVLVTADALGEVGTGATEVLPLEQTVADYDSITDHRPVRSWLRWDR